MAIAAKVSGEDDGGARDIGGGNPAPQPPHADGGDARRSVRRPNRGGFSGRIASMGDLDASESE